MHFLDPEKKTCFFLPLSLPISLSITLHRIFSNNKFCKTRKNHYNLIRRFFSPSYFSHFDFFGQKHQIFSPFFSNFQPITIYHSPIFVSITPVPTLSWLCALKWLPFQKTKNQGMEHGTPPIVNHQNRILIDISKRLSDRAQPPFPHNIETTSLDITSTYSYMLYNNYQYS